MLFTEKKIHATALIAGDMGILIRGQSGSGKSTLARQVISYAQRDTHFARLISDDRVHLVSANGRIIANSISTIEGMLEIRGMGIMPAPFLNAAIIDLVVDLDIFPQRAPEECDKITDLLNIPLPRLSLGGFSDAAERLIWFITHRASLKV